MIYCMRIKIYKKAIIGANFSTDTQRAAEGQNPVLTGFYGPRPHLHYNSIGRSMHMLHLFL